MGSVLLCGKVKEAVPIVLCGFMSGAEALRSLHSLHAWQALFLKCFVVMQT